MTSIFDILKKEREVKEKQCPTLYVPMDCSPPGSSAHGIFQARTLEWGAIAFSGPLHWLCASQASQVAQW